MAGTGRVRVVVLPPAPAILYMLTVSMYSIGMPTPSDLPPPSMGYLVWHLTLRWRAELDRALAPLGLTSAQYAVLASLYGLSQSGARPSQRELADFAGLEPMHVSKLVRALQRAGLVARAGNPADTRAVQLSVTGRGVQVVTAARATVLELEEQRLAPLGGRSSQRSGELREALLVLLRHTQAPSSASERSVAARPAPTARGPDQATR
jgi:DNA-binding MarR family transcriptional regulator